MLRAGVLGAAISAILMAGPAMAGDFNWSGAYLGIHGGYSWADIDYPGAPPYVPTPIPPGVTSGPPRPSLEGGLVGGQIGYNFQYQSVVFGVEADWSFANMDATERDGNFITQSYEINGFGSLRGRLGLAIGNFLPYATGGWAWADTSFNQSCGAGAPGTTHCSPARAGTYSKTDDQTVDGYVYGGGVEAALSENWSLRAEYLRYDFDKQAYDLGASPNGFALGSKTLEHDIEVVRAAVSYRFGEHRAPAPLK